LGRAIRNSSLKEFLINKINLINFIPELVEKRPPPIIVKKRKTIDSSLGELFKPIPMFDMLDIIERKMTWYEL